jgi:hypothetical protein
MRSAFLVAAALAGTLGAAACGGSSPTSMMNPVTPVSPSASSSAVAGTWTGASSDSTGSMMGAGLSASMMSGMTWQLTQSGNTFTGTMSFPGYGGHTMTVSGTIDGRSGTFTMMVPAGSMMMAGCTATATGSFDMDDLMDQIHGTYSGSNTCTGPFDHGEISLTHH